MATTSRTDLISETSVAFMRAIRVTWTIKNAKPNTDMFAFFDGFSVDQFITPRSGVRGGQVTTNDAGEASGFFDITDFTYNTGTKELLFLDTEDYNAFILPGSSVSSAAANFTSTGILRTTQETIEEEIVVIPPPPPISRPIDPLAQSFFTHGVTGGISVVKIDIFFRTKETDGSVPVILELRKLSNGYPANELAQPYARVTIKPEDIIVSNDASEATSFIFDTPIYLPENGDWCFVLISNSDKYNVWTAKMGEKSIETGRTIFEQPFIGTMFKSENNITWTTDSTEDIKFKIHRAEYSPTANVQLTAKANKFFMYGDDMEVTSGSNVITINFKFLHGLRSSDKFRLVAPADAAVYRGVTAAQLTGLYTVTYIDPFTISVQLPVGTFTSTGTLAFSGIVNEIQVDAGGTGYSVAPTITINGTCTTPAAATATIRNGSIISITVTDSGSGYVDKPTITVTGTGTGESLFLVSEGVFGIETNRVFDSVIPSVVTDVPTFSSISSIMKTTSKDYFIGSPADVVLDTWSPLKQNSILVSTDNNAAFLPGQQTTALTLNLSTSVSTVSPVVYISEARTLQCIAYIINNQTEYESVDPAITAGSASIATCGITAPGVGYTSAAVTVSAPDVPGGTQAVITATLNTGAVSTLVVSNAGTGYLKPPTVVMTEVVANPAVLTPVLTPFNSELLPEGGSALSRYITKPITIVTVSTGVVITVNAYSPSVASFDLYFRSSLKSNSSVHVNEPWKMMYCETSRNLSTSLDEFIDYTFALNGLDPFDIYDIKIVMRSTSSSKIPVIANYRAIVLV